MGLIKGTVALTASAIGRSNRKREIRKIHYANESNKNILKLGTVSINSLLSNTAMQNVIVSGGSKETRDKFIVEKCVQDSIANVPVLIIHEGNPALENMLKSSLPANRYLRNINKNNPYYDPIYRTNSTETGIIISEAFPTMDENGVLLVKSIYRILQYKRIPFLKKLLNCPYDQLSIGVAKLEQAGVISRNEATALQNDITTGMALKSQVELILSKLFKEADIIPDKSDLSRTTSIAECVDHKGGVLVIDISSMKRDGLISLLSAEINAVLKKGCNLSVIIDAQTIAKNDSLVDILTSEGPNLSWMLSSPSLTEMINTKEGGLSQWLSNSAKSILFSHNQHGSEMISKEFGEYDHIEIQQSLGGGNGMGQQFGYHYSGQSGLVTTVERRARVMPEEIVTLGSNMFYMLDNTRGVLAKGSI